MFGLLSTAAVVSQPHYCAAILAAATRSTAWWFPADASWPVADWTSVSLPVADPAGDDLPFLLERLALELAFPGNQGYRFQSVPASRYLFGFSAGLVSASHTYSGCASISVRGRNMS